MDIKKKILLSVFFIIFFHYILIFSGTLKYFIFLNSLGKSTISNNQTYNRDLLVNDLTNDILYKNEFNTKDINELVSFLLITKNEIKSKNFIKVVKENIKDLKINYPLLNQFSFSIFNNEKVKINFEFSYLKLTWNVSIKKI